VISSNFKCPGASSPPEEVHFFLSYEDWSTSYWSYEDEYKPGGEREAIAEPTASLGVSNSYVNRLFVSAEGDETDPLPLMWVSRSEKRGFYIQFIPEDFEVLSDENALGASTSTK
jgi:hypothetical protein